MKKYVTLGEVCTKGSSSIAQKDIEQNNGSYGIYGASGYIKDVDFYHQDKPYIAVVKDGAGIGRTMLLPEKTSIIGTMQYLIPNDDVCVEYLYYAVTYMNLAKYFSGATIPHIYFKDYQKEKLPLLTIEEQRKIADNLRKIDRLIELCSGILQKLDVLVKSRFVEMFGDPETNPKEWKKEELKKHADVLVGYPFSSEDYTTEGIKIVGGYNLMQGFIQWSISKCWSDTIGFEQYLLQENDIVMAMDRPWVNGGFKIARIDSEHLPALLIQRTACIRSQKEMEQAFLFYMLDTERFASHCNITGSLVPHISNKDINNFKIIIPPLELQQQFAAFVEQTDKSKFIAINIKKNIRRVRLYDQF